MTDTEGFSRTFDALADELEPSLKSEISDGRRKRGASGIAGKGEAVLQVVERDGVLHVEEAEPGGRRRGKGTTAAEEEVKYERKFELLDRSEIGTWLERLDTRTAGPRRRRARTSRCGPDGWPYPAPHTRHLLGE